MSTEIENTEYDKGGLTTFTNFFGGDKHGVCLQITQGTGYIQLSQKDAYMLLQTVATWLKDSSRERANKLAETIKEYKELEKTILKDAVECERFISDLEVIKIPLQLLGLTKLENNND